jgi:RNA polymerase sigma-70 factor (ECF subfamily)
LSAPEKNRFVSGIAKEYGGRLKRFLRLRTSNDADVPDLAQEVFLSLLRAPHHEDIRSPEAYLFTVASHIVQQHQQRRAVDPAPLDWIERLADVPLSTSDEPPEKFEMNQRVEHLERMLDAMPPRMAMALVMQRVAGHSVEEIARELGVAEITIKKDLAKALLRCRAQGMEPSDG